MTSFIYIGDPRDHFRMTTRDEKGRKLRESKRVMTPDHDQVGRSTTIFGYDFVLNGDPVEVDAKTAAKLSNNAHFVEVKAKAKRGKTK